VLQLLQLLTTQQSETGCFRSADCGERDIMSQETIDRVLTIERQASGEFVSAQQQAARIVQDAKAEASNEYHEALRIAKERAKEIEQAKQETADAEHQRILAAARSDASKMAAKAKQHVDEAVEFILDRIIGRR